MCNNCNPCNDCESKHTPCCNPNIVSGNECLSVDTSEEGKITITATCPPEVSSDDGSIIVKEKTPTEGHSTRYDLSLNKEDKYVGACDGDEHPSTLDDKLRVKSPLTRETVGCTGEDAHIVLGLDQSKLDLPDKKVAVDSGCEGKYLSEVLKCDAEGLEFVKSGCTLTLRKKDGGFTGGKITLTDNVIGKIPRATDGVFYVTASDGGQMLKGNFDIDFMYGDVEYSGGGIKILADGIYDVGYRCSFEASFGVHAMRGGLFVMNQGGTGFSPLCEDRYSAPVGSEPFNIGRGEDGYNGTYIADVTESTGVAGKSASLGAVLDRMPCGYTTLAELHAGDIIFLGMKGQTRTQYTEGDTIQWDQEAGEIAMVGRNGNQAGADIGAQIWIAQRYAL